MNKFMNGLVIAMTIYWGAGVIKLLENGHYGWAMVVAISAGLLFV